VCITSDSSRRTPLFLQFVEAVYQIHSQFPNAFEFSAELLVFLADHVDSGFFGTFLNNCLRNRFCMDHAHEHTLSVWSYVFTFKHLFVQSSANGSANLYRPVNDVIWPVSNPHRLQVWWRYYGRWFPECHPRASNAESHGVGHGVNADGWHDDW
jgi:myotubularin-related protein 1/2